MKKRIISLIITMLVIMTTFIPAFSLSANRVNTFLEKIESLSVEERESYIILLTPLLMVDSGIDDLIKNVNNYESGKTDTMMGKYIGELLKYAEKDILVNFLESFKATNITARRSFLETLRYKKPITLSSKTKTAVNTLLSGLYSDMPALKTLMEEGGYNEEIIANLIKGFVEINGSEALYEFNGDRFSAGEVHYELDSNIKNIWSEYVFTDNGLRKISDDVSGEEVSLSFVLENSVNILNENIAPEKRTLIAEGLSELGLVKIKNDKKPDSESGESSGANTQIPEQLKPDKEIDINLEGEDIKTVTLETDMKRPVLYKKDGAELRLVKYSALHEGKLIAKVSESGTYVIKEQPSKFTDCDGWAKDYIEMLAARGIINGKAENLYMPNDTITREEFVKLIVELLDILKSEKETVFADVNKDAWYAGYVNAAFENKIINGVSEKEFGVGMSIKRQDMAKIINTVLELKGIKSNPADETVFVDYSAIAQYAKTHVLSIYNMGIISGDENKNFNPNNFATRAEAAKMVYGMLVQLILH